MISEQLLKNEELAVYRLRELYSSFGYTQYKMNKFEEYDLYVRNKDFLISDRVITFTDTNGKLLALKPDVTLSIINNFAKTPCGIQKMYYDENVYRVSGGTGRFKEIMQTGLECIGEIGIYEISEVLYLAKKSLWVIDADYSLEVAHAGFIQSLLKDIGIEDKLASDVLDDISAKSTVKSDALLSQGKLTKNQTEIISSLIVSFADVSEFTEEFKKYGMSTETKKYFDEFVSVINSVSSDKITVNFSIAGQAGYYSGIVFKGYINGIPQSVLSGGQYDKLIRKFAGTGGAVGFAVYLDSFERFKAVTPEYDVDVIILAASDDSPEKILQFAEKIKNGGESVLVQTKIPDNIKYRRVVRIEG